MSVLAKELIFLDRAPKSPYFECNGSHLAFQWLGNTGESESVVHPESALGGRGALVAPGGFCGDLPLA
ncbi:MAG: hypothetical protein DMG30_15145 [Acidobacteria bacterium]|nr:MAG: hypothetical protein DMG30_15145 [Acidobacteriota bacterium]